MVTDLETTGKVFGKHDENAVEQFREVSTRAVRSALMADGHFGYGYPVGGVTAYRQQVSVLGVGVDIACGNAAIRTNHTTLSLLGRDAEELRGGSRSSVATAIADELFSELGFGLVRKNRSDDAPVDDPLFDDPAWAALPDAIRDELRERARHQLGTIGAGNHYVDVFYDENGAIWVGNHFGSRGLGFTIGNGFLALGQGQPWGGKADHNRDVILDLRSPMGDAYWQLLQLAGKYAYAGREWVVRKAVSILGGTEMELVHNHHNFAWRERQLGPTGLVEDLIVVRKGSTPAFPGQYGFVGGSMGDDAVILRGSARVGEGIIAEQNAALFSTVHGAGRVMGRKAALGKIQTRKAWVCGQRDCGGTLDAGTTRLENGANPRCPKCGSKTFKRPVEVPGGERRPGLVNPAEVREWLDRKGVVLRGGDLDEAPQCYRRLPDVLAAQGRTIEIVHTLTPLIVCMAPADTVDPFKD